MRFRVRTDSLTFAERKPPATNANRFASTEPAFELLERIKTVQRESLT